MLSCGCRLVPNRHDKGSDNDGRLTCQYPIDIMEAARQIGTIILLSGDGDFELLLEKVKKSYGVTVEV